MLDRRNDRLRDRLLRLTEVAPWIYLVPATLLSFAFTGYIPVFNNNIYHTPILLQTYELPQFANDAFIQSLRSFSSGFWILFAGAGHVVDVELFLGVWLFVSHLAFLAACLHLAGSFGLHDNRQRNLFLLIISCSSLVYDMAVGGGGLMIEYFTHSELANASLLLGLSYALRRRYGPAAVFVCVTFFLNAFMAIWMLPPLGLLALCQLFRRTLAWQRLLIDGLLGSLAGSVFLVLPVRNVLQNAGADGPLDFSYSAYLTDYFPYHFFLSSLSTNELATLGLSMVVLLMTLRLQGNEARELMAVGIGAILVVALSTVVPLVTDSRFVLNLHLVRGFVVVQMLLAVSLATLAVRWLTVETMRARFALGLALFVGLLGSSVGLALAVVLLLWDWSLGGRPAFEPSFSRKIAKVCLFSLLAILPIRAAGVWYAATVETSAVRLWERVGVWARQQTPSDAVFYVPESGAAVFSMVAERQLWFVPKYGAAVMWSPSYYPIWRERAAQTRGTPSPEHLEQVSAGAIDFVAADCSRPTARPPVHQDAAICVYKLD